MKLSFGSDDALRVVRQVEEKRDTAMITGRQKTTRTVKLFVSNAGGDSPRVAIEERVLVSEVKEVEVRVLEKETRPAPGGVSKDGIARFELSLQPRSQQELVFAWEISASSKVVGL